MKISGALMTIKGIIFTTLILLASLPTFAASVRVQIVDVGQADGIVI